MALGVLAMLGASDGVTEGPSAREDDALEADDAYGTVFVTVGRSGVANDPRSAKLEVHADKFAAGRIAEFLNDQLSAIQVGGGSSETRCRVAQPYSRRRRRPRY